LRWIQEKLSVALWMGLDTAPKKRIIDLGTGAGWFVYVCRKMGHECYGTDMLGRSEYDAGYEFLGIDILGELTYPMQKMNLDGKFDYITTMRSFLGQRPNAWSKEEWKFFLEDMRNHLNDNGALYLACNSGSKLDKRYRHLPLEERSFWGDKELGPWFNPYLIDSKNQIRGMKPNTLYILKNDIQKLLDT
jgi:cyclopropane fatty-acyl-phospholipid synthase-like methyltransferase